jgi:thiol:disulfide interchange protein DsbA
MNLPTITKSILHALIASNFFLVQGAMAANPYAGLYDVIATPVNTATPDKVEVVGLFWYTCPHCYSFEKNYLKAWRENKPDYVVFTHMPAVFDLNDRGTPLAKAYYVAKELKILDKIHTPLFKKIHDKHRRMNSKNAIRSFFVKYGGVSEQDFDDTYNNSFYVDTSMRKAKDKTKKYGVGSVPTVIVNGKYRLNSRKTKGYKNMMAVIKYLVEEEYKLISAKTKKSAEK